INVSAKPVAAYTIPNLTCINDAITFTDSSTIAPGTAANTINNWQWNFDDGNGLISISTNATQTKRYASWGNKNVKLVVTSNTGCVSDTF
ncbi:PKD domain-containing protein, partial [Acinetobacter baumannii]